MAMYMIAVEVTVIWPLCFIRLLQSASDKAVDGTGSFYLFPVAVNKFSDGNIELRNKISERWINR